MPAEPIYPKHFFESGEFGSRRMCFVLMPFRSELAGVYTAVARACLSTGYECLRADEIDRPGAILVQIMRHIQESQVVVADLSGSNPNVFYELGMAHVRKENVILLAQEVDQIPFDLRHWRLIEYENTPSGRRKLRARVERMIRLLPAESMMPAQQADELASILERRQLNTPESTAFGANELGGRVITRHEQCEHGAERSRFVVFCGGPYQVGPDIIDTASSEFRKWFDPNARRYAPSTGSFFVPYETKKPTLDGILATETSRDAGLRSYLLVMKNGYVERGRDLAMCYKGQAVFRLTPLVSELWQFIRFMQELYEFQKSESRFKVLVSMVNTRHSQLCDLGRGWREPFELGGLPGEQFTCDLPNLQLSIDDLSRTTADGDVDLKVRGLAGLIDDAYGFFEARAFNSPRAESPGALNPQYT